MPDAAFDRWVSPASMTEVIKFLLSPASRDITGALLPVTGRV
jgi:NAD(P)-dependent dehydrogenase (short-subunit alcohol dehydrogenase family)